MVEASKPPTGVKESNSQKTLPEDQKEEAQSDKSPTVDAKTSETGGA